MTQNRHMQVNWDSIGRGDTGRFEGATVDIRGWFAPIATGRVRYGALVADADCCGAHLTLRPASTVEVFLARPLAAHGLRQCTLRGRWVHRREADDGWRFQLRDAHVVAGADAPGLPARRLFLGAAAAGLAACSAGPFRAYAESTPSTLPVEPSTRTAITIDAHSHAGRVISARQQNAAVGRPFTPLAAPMREGGMNIVCLAVVADTPATRISADGRRFEPYREPAPGELYAHAKRAFARCAALIEQQDLHVVLDLAGLHAAPARGPSVIVTSEGADFLEGRIERVDEAWREHHLRQLQLTHYRVNELGDIQTEPPVHGGLTDFGAAVIERCNALGIVVDVAHGPFELVERAAKVTRRPLVLSHTSLVTTPAPRSRQISAAHARLVAATDGIVGVWPNVASFANLDAMAHGAKALADVIGADHVALGTDMLGFIATPVLTSYRQIPAYAKALRDAGFTSAEVDKVLGANYVRVFEATLDGAPVASPQAT